MLLIGAIMTTSVVTATADMTLQEAMELLSERHISALPVLEGDLVVGLFSSSDLIAYIAELSDTTESVSFEREKKRTTMLEDATVGDVMTRKIQSLPSDATVDEAASLMAEKQIHRILVMDEGALVGILSVSDVAKAVANHKLKTVTYLFA
jgi:CBS domain-containing membrane protein